MTAKILQNLAFESLPIMKKVVAYHLQKMQKGQLILEEEGQLSRFGDGDELRAHISVSNPDFYKKIVLSADIGLGESYVDGDWDSDRLADVIRWFILNIDQNPSMSGGKLTEGLLINGMSHINRARHLLRGNSLKGSKRNIVDHYDLGNEFFASFLDPSMMYSSALFDRSEDLHQAQIRKLEHLAEMARVKPHHEVLEIGTGWGEFACFLAERYGCRVTTLTISDEQFQYAQQKVASRQLQDKVTVLNCDYRLYSGSFDRIFTIEMLEAVGDQFMPTFFQKCSEWLKPSGCMAHQVILSPDSRYAQFRDGIDWIQKHIFPGSLLPSVSSLLQAANRNGVEFVLQDYKDMGLDYVKTLASWRDNFIKNKDNATSLSKEFCRKWLYYLSYCEAAFSMRNITVAQLLFTRPNNYQAD